MVDYAALFAVAVACIGAFGLTSLAVSRRYREVGIREVLGGSAARIAALLLRDFGVLAATGALLAAPVAYRVPRGWLAGFAYRIDLAWIIHEMRRTLCSRGGFPMCGFDGLTDRTNGASACFHGSTRISPGLVPRIRELIRLGPVLLLAGGLLALLLVAGSVSYQCVRAPLVNPVDVPRHE